MSASRGSQGRPSTESDPLPTDGPVGGRSLTVNAILALASSGVRTSAIRLPRTVHALDAATLFRLALEQAPAGSAWHAVADEGDQVRDIAAVIGRRLAVPVESVPTETLGPLGPIFATDQPASSHHTRQALGWEPTHPSLLHDLELIEP